MEPLLRSNHLPSPNPRAALPPQGLTLPLRDQLLTPSTPPPPFKLPLLPLYQLPLTHLREPDAGGEGAEVLVERPPQEGRGQLERGVAGVRLLRVLAGAEVVGDAGGAAGAVGGDALGEERRLPIWLARMALVSP